ncbi:hypothetical protein [Luteolibacter soli]|uniref:Uncharacterized protein n=1 Tax=Luteolibacter soli TaxID=3135280 RepID=A0ABU9AVJ2_9BACT
MNAPAATTYCIRCLRRTCDDCRVGDAVEASRIPEWDSTSETRFHHPTGTVTGTSAPSKPWKFRRTSIAGLHHGTTDSVWVRVQ